MCIQTAGSLSCTVETNSSIKQLYPPPKKNQAQGAVYINTPSAPCLQVVAKEVR